MQRGPRVNPPPPGPGERLRREIADPSGLSPDRVGRCVALGLAGLLEEVKLLRREVARLADLHAETKETPDGS